jgi:hypothetical protein
VAVQVTAVEPTGNDEPLGGAHDTDIGAVPPLTVGAPNVTTADCPLVAVAGIGVAGHASVGGGMIVVVDGCVGLLHPKATAAADTSAVGMARRRCCG